MSVLPGSRSCTVGPSGGRKADPIPARRSWEGCLIFLHGSPMEVQFYVQKRLHMRGCAPPQECLSSQEHTHPKDKSPKAPTFSSSTRDLPTPTPETPRHSRPRRPISKIPAAFASIVYASAEPHIVSTANSLAQYFSSQEDPFAGKNFSKQYPKCLKQPLTTLLSHRRST